MSQMSLVKAGRAQENRAYVRMLLWQLQPAFAAALASAEQDVSCSACSGRIWGRCEQAESAGPRDSLRATVRA
jgi:hypothetical protein